ncbi:flagellar assembly protein A [Sulfurimonas microaerophilic]|uniref:flagellar assembly protein A n=1 Tax=Sulfurimonas microaerophilic TaxID=3058392 RepID=UPI0027153AB2|nr:flagellar assembly protein A [Sulfurimonas sp. hsl 1-7]
MISFAPFTKKTVSIPKTLKNYTQQKNINIKDIDFTLEKYETLVRRKDIKDDLIVENPAEIDQEILLDKDARIYQRYDIKIFPSDLDINSYKITLAANKQKTKVIAIIKAGSIFNKDDTLSEKLLTQIRHKKLATGFLIDIFEEGLEKQLEKLVKILPYGKKLTKDVKFVVAKGIEPIDGNDGELQKVYLSYQQDEQRNYIDGIKKGELILRYKKPLNGSGGRSCEGKYIPEKLAQNFTIPEMDESVILKENDRFLEFYANDNGFVEYDDKTLKISKMLKLEGADYKSTGHLDAKELKDEISVEIRHNKEAYDDAIGEGLKVDVKDLHVNGSIGSNVNVAAKSVNIDAQTHKRATFTVEEKANIKLHRGDLTANHAEIEILETGKITAHKSIHVKKVVGGELIAPKIYIDELVSNAKIIASELIEIKSIRGSNNTLMINPDKVKAYHQEKEDLKNGIKNKKKKYQEEFDALHKEIAEHAQEIDRIKTFQKRILAAQSTGKAPTKQDLIRVREYKRKSQEFKEREDQFKEKEESIKQMEAELEKLLEQDLHAEIRTKSLYDGHIKVIFVNPDDGKELVFMPQGQVEVISLKLDERNNRVIKT